jgi:hypothetical protein
MIASKPVFQSALFYDKDNDFIDTISTLQTREDKRSLSAHPHRIRLHYV